MRGLCGWFSERADPNGEQTLRGMVERQPTAATIARSIVGPHGAIAALGEGATAQWAEVDRVHIVALGHPRVTSGGARHGDLTAIATAWRARGKAALSELGGDFAIVAWDSERRSGLLAADRLAVHPLMYAWIDGTLAFASTLDLLTSFPGVARELSHQALYDYFYYHVVPGPGTAFKGLVKVPPGHCVEFGAQAPRAPSAYWSMRFQEDRRSTFSDFKSRFRPALEAAVSEAALPDHCGTFLSGGTDSSTVTGVLAKINGRNVPAFSIGFDAQGYDETGYARIAARHFACEHHEYYVTPSDVVDAIPKIVAAYDQPFGNASAIPTYYCARLAREHGVQRMLAGDGGDEVFGGNERYARQYLLSLYDTVPAPLRSSVIEPWLLSLPADSAIMPLRKLRSYVVQARSPMPLRYESYNVFQHLGAQNVLSPEFLASVDQGHPRQLLHEAHAPYGADSLINQMLGIDLRFTLTDNDLPKVTRICDLAGVDVAFPLLDDRLIDFAGQLPAHMKLKRTRLRWFFKEALRDFLPPEIIQKKKHGFGLPAGVWLRDHRPLFDMAMAGAQSVVNKGIVRRGFLDDLVGPRMQEDAAYFGNMLWVLMMLGLWLDSRRV